METGTKLPPMPSNGQTLLIGRAENCDIVVDSNNVSRTHAQISNERGLYYIKDLGSSNGTVVNGQKIKQESQLVAGDLIQVGDCRMLFDGQKLEMKAADEMRTPTRKPIVKLKLAASGKKKGQLIEVSTRNASAVRIIALLGLLVAALVGVAVLAPDTFSKKETTSVLSFQLIADGKVVLSPPSSALTGLEMTIHFPDEGLEVVKKATDIEWSDDGGFSVKLKVNSEHLPTRAVVTIVCPGYTSQQFTNLQVVKMNPFPELKVPNTTLERTSE